MRKYEKQNWGKRRVRLKVSVTPQNGVRDVPARSAFSTPPPPSFQISLLWRVAAGQGRPVLRFLARMLAALLCAAVVCLTGCARFVPRLLSPSDAAKHLEERSLTNSEIKTFLERSLPRNLEAWPPPIWDFEMLSLAALYFHPSLEVARAQWAVARGGESTAAQQPNPTLNITPGYNSTTPMASPWFPLGTLDVPIETAGKRGIRRAQAARLAEAARLNIATIAWQVRSTLRAHLVELETAGLRNKLLGQQLALQEQIVTALEQQAKAGALPGSAVLPQRISLTKIQIDISDAERSRAESRGRVAEDIGISISALNQIEFSYALETRIAGGDLNLKQFRTSALQSRADILGALAEYSAAQSALQLEIAKQYPDIHLQPGYQFDQGDNKWSLGIIVELPVFSQNQGPIAEAKAKREEAAAKFNAVQAKVLAEIDRAIEVLKVAHQTIGRAQSLIETAAQRRDSVAAELQAGAIDRLELLNAESEYHAAQLAQVDAQAHFHQAIGALEDALQMRFNLPGEIFDSTPGHAR